MPFINPIVYISAVYHVHLCLPLQIHKHPKTTKKVYKHIFSELIIIFCCAIHSYFFLIFFKDVEVFCQVNLCWVVGVYLIKETERVRMVIELRV